MSGCSASPASATLGTNGSTTIVVSYSGASGGGSGTVTLVGTGRTGSNTDDGWINVTVNAPPSYTVAVTPDGTQNYASDGGGTINPDFTVTPTGNQNATYNLSLSWTGVSGCSLNSASQVALSVGALSLKTKSCTNAGPGTSGTVTLTAAYSGNTSISDAGSVTTSVNTYTVDVRDDNTSVTLNAGTASSQTFTVQNNGNSSATYTLNAVCSNGTSGCSSPAPLPLGPTASQNVTVNYTAGAGGTLGRVTLIASAGTGSSATRDSGWVTVSAVAPWTVAINPPPLAESSPVSVTIYWCDRNFNFSDGSRHIYFKGQDVTSQFTYTNQGLGTFGCTQYYGGSVYNAVSTGTVTLSGGQIVDTLSASINDVNGTLLSATRAWQPLSYQVAVTPHGGVASPAPNQSGVTQTFQVRNYGNATPSSYALTVVCSGSVSGCSGPSSVVVSPGAANQQSVTVTYTSGAANSLGTIQLTATASGFSDVGAVNVRAGSNGEPVTRVLATEINPGTSIDRASCLDFAIVRDVGSECGALRITHALPSVRTLNKVRTPTLIYYSDELDSTTLAVHLILADTATVPDSVWLRLWDVTSGTQVALGLERKYGGSAWQTNRKQRLTVSQIAKGSTRIIKYQVEVKLKYGAQWSTSFYGNGQLAFVNRSLSRFGAGWWLAGVERVFVGQPDSSVLWVAGDGSTRKYARAVETDTVYLAEAVRRPDTLFRTAQGGFRRSLPNGAQVYFTSDGLDTATVNLLGHRTRFKWGNNVSGEPRLDSLVVPGSVTVAYTFIYDAAGQDSVIVAPAVVNQPRQLILTRTASGTGVSRISGPDANAVAFEFQTSAPDRLYLARTDRHGARTQFGFEASSPTLAYASTPDGTGKTVVDSLSTVVGAGASPTSAPRRVDSVYFRFRGPRTDSAQVTQLWVDRFGAPTQIIDAVGKTVTIRRDDWRFPGLVTRVEYPVITGLGQRAQTATFDARGDVKTVAELSPYTPNDNTDAVARFEYDDSNWPAFVTRIVPPERDSTVIAYNSDGTRAWQQLGDNASRRTTFSYYSSGLTTRLLQIVQSPGGLRDSIGYDSNGNLSVTRSPLGVETHFESDPIGRTTVVRHQIDRGNYALWQDDSASYDNMDRAVREVQYGPRVRTGTITAVDTQKVVVEHVRIATGGDSILRRWSQPDPRSVGHIISEWRFDLLGRPIAAIAPDGAIDSTRYDEAGNPIRVRTRRGDTLAMSYDRLNRLSKRTTWNITYPARANQGIASLSLLNLGQKSYPYFPTNPTDGSLTISGDVTTYAYDALGNMTRADNGDALVRRGYFLNGATRSDTLIIKTYTGRDTSTMHRYVIGHLYDLDGRETVLKHPSQLAPQGVGARDSVIYQYDPVGQLAAVIDPIGNPFQFTYDALGRRIRLAMPGAVRDSSVYDNDDELIRSFVFSGIATTLRNQSLSYDAASRVLSMQNVIGLMDTVLSTYSPLGHVVQRQYWQPVASSFGIPGRIYNTERFTLDALGNRLSSYDSTNLSSPTTTQTLRTNQSLYYNMAGVPPTGRLRMLGTALRNDSTLYDASGNTIFSFTYAWPLQPPPSTNLEDHASFYAADKRLRFEEYRTVSNQQGYGDWFANFEEYRYDALGRRVLVRTRRMCAQQDNSSAADCKESTMRRIVWDGGQELYEIQMPGLDADSTYWENDTAHVHFPSYTFPIVTDLNPQFGRIAYTNALGIDAPIAITRINYVDSVSNKVAGFHNYPPFTVVPHWDWQLNADWGTMGDGQSQFCYPGESTRCVSPTWHHKTYAFLQNPSDTLFGWYGSLLEDRRDAGGLLYRRNRYVDPTTGRFTQEDPIGLAGGLNVYGFAGGDPVNFSDPFGLCPPKDNTPCPAQQIDNSDGLGWARFAGAMLKPAQPILEAAGNAEMAFMPLGELGEAANITKLGLREGRVEEGIYEFTATSEKVYVGQSGSISQRLLQHVRSGKLAASDVTSVSRTEVLGGKTAREIAEQRRINQLGGIVNLENKINPIGPARQHLLNNP